MSRMFEYPAVSNMLDNYFCPMCSLPSIRILDKHYSHSELKNYYKSENVKPHRSRPHEDQSMCTIIDNQLFCAEKELVLGTA